MRCVWRMRVMHSAVNEASKYEYYGDDFHFLYAQHVALADRALRCFKASKYE